MIPTRAPDFEVNNLKLWFDELVITRQSPVGVWVSKLYWCDRSKTLSYFASADITVDDVSTILPADLYDERRKKTLEEARTEYTPRWSVGYERRHFFLGRRIHPNF